MKRKKRKSLLTGWSIKGKPFSKREWGRTALKKYGASRTYQAYLREWKRQYKIKRLRKSLIS